MEAHLGRRLGPAAGAPAWESEEDHLGWHETGDGTWFLGVHVPAGRIRDTDGARYRSGLRGGRRAAGHRRAVDRPPGRAAAPGSPPTSGRVEGILREAGVPLAEDVPAPASGSALACPALPTCGLALGEAERVLPDVLGDRTPPSTPPAWATWRPVRVRMTGCPNGCARPYTAELGIVGRGKTSYDLHVGGSAVGDRLAERIRADVPLDQIPAVLAPVLARYADRPSGDASFGDWTAAAGTSTVATWLPEPVVRRRSRAAPS